MTEYQELVSQFKELMERGERDQWKLAETASLAVGSKTEDGEEVTATKFAKDTGYQKATVYKYLKAHAYRESIDDRHITFADALVLGNASPERATAIDVLAGAMGKTISSARDDTEAVNIVQEFLTDNPELVTQALKDDDARSAVASAAFNAAKQDVVAGAEGLTKDAAKGKATAKPKADPRGIKAVEIQRFLFDVQRAARENSLVTTRWQRDLDALKNDMSVDELTEVYDALGLMYDRIAAMRVDIDGVIKVRA